MIPAVVTGLNLNKSLIFLRSLPLSWGGVGCSVRDPPLRDSSPRSNVLARRWRAESGSRASERIHDGVTQRLSEPAERERRGRLLKCVWIHDSSTHSPGSSDRTSVNLRRQITKSITYLHKNKHSEHYNLNYNNLIFLFFKAVIWAALLRSSSRICSFLCMLGQQSIRAKVLNIPIKISVTEKSIFKKQIEGAWLEWLVIRMIDCVIMVFLVILL